MTRTPRSTTRRPRCKQPGSSTPSSRCITARPLRAASRISTSSGYSDSDYYYISGTRTPELSISGGAAQQPADTPKEPARDPEPDKPAGKATLSITSRPNKTSYYIGDKLNTAGLTARYTDASGKAQTITSGFTTNADMTSAGAKQVTVTYRDASSTFSISVKEPSVTVTQEELNEGLRLYATTGSRRSGRDLELVESARRVL